MIKNKRHFVSVAVAFAIAAYPLFASEVQEQEQVKVEEVAPPAPVIEEEAAPAPAPAVEEVANPECACTSCN